MKKRKMQKNSLLQNGVTLIGTRTNITSPWVFIFKMVI